MFFWNFHLHTNLLTIWGAWAKHLKGNHSINSYKLVELNAKLKFKKEAKEKHIWVEEVITWDLGEAKSNQLATKESIEELKNKNIALENNNVANFVLNYKASWRMREQFVFNYICRKLKQKQVVYDYIVA
jgi:hypothetical protein